MKNENSEKKERNSPNFRENFSNRPIFVYHTILLDKLYEKSQKLSMYAVFVQSVYNYFYRLGIGLINVESLTIFKNVMSNPALFYLYL